MNDEIILTKDGQEQLDDWVRRRMQMFTEYKIFYVING